MLVLITQIVYGAVFLMMLLMSLFIVYHIVAYSYTHISRVITLAIFLPVVGVLLFVNLVSFWSIPLENILSKILP
jgi:hypothetical protein